MKKIFPVPTKTKLSSILNETKPKNRWQYFLPAVFWMILVIGLSLLPARSLSSRKILLIPHLDKLVHFTFYFILSVAILYGLKKVEKLESKYVLTTFLFSSLLGLALELAQGGLLAGRHFEILDIITNIIGASLGCLLFMKF